MKVRAHMERLTALLVLFNAFFSFVGALPDSWLGAEVTESERLGVGVMKSSGDHQQIMGHNLIKSGLNTTDIDRLRFLRQQRGNVDKALMSLAAHTEWVVGDEGSEMIMSKYRQEFDASVLNDEFIWIGLSQDNCPTIVIRSQLHDGADYGEDPHYFVKYLIYLLELGKSEWGIGPEKGFCMIVDRTDAVRRSTGEVMTDQLDFSVIPNLIDLFRVIYSNLNDHYPKLLVRAQVVPTSWFYSTCWGLVSKLVDKSISSKFEVIQERDIAERLSHQFPREILPLRFGGTSEDFVRYSFTSEKEQSQVVEQVNSTVAEGSIPAVPKRDSHDRVSHEEDNDGGKATDIDSGDDITSFIMRIVEGDGFDSSNF